jgi:hypothetical protein
MTISKNRAGFSKSLITNNHLPSDFKVKVESFYVEFVKYFNPQNSRSQAQTFMVSFEAFNLLIQESYDAKRVAHDL